MARRIRKVNSRPRKIITFKVSEDFFNLVDRERKKFFNTTGINLTQPVMSNLIIKSVKPNFLEEGNIFKNGTKKTKKKR